MIPENIYGHSKRLNWIVSHLQKTDKVIEVGCGTGSMITIPLAKAGYSINGFDLDKTSIEYGQRLLRRQGLEGTILSSKNLSELEKCPDVIIASEVLEHLNDRDLEQMLMIIRDKLKHGGLLLITVPNGYGWFELESFLWFKTGIGYLMEKLHLVGIIWRIKERVFGCHRGEPYPPSTLADSPHVRRFTWSSLSALLSQYGFEVVSNMGSVMFAGPFSNLFFTSIEPIMRLNCKLGGWFPKIAAGYYVACRLPCK